MNTYEAFKESMDRLKANYGAAHFSKEKIALFWAYLKKISPSHILKITDQVISENEFPPVLAHFMKHIQIAKDQEQILENEKRRSQEVWEWNSPPPDIKIKLDEWKKNNGL